MKFSADSDLEAPLELNLTSLIDVLFTLLTFFMVSTSFVVSRGLNVTLPSTKGTTGETAATPVIVTVQRDGTVSVDGTVMPNEQLVTLLQERAAAGTADSVIVRADRDATHGSVVTVMELAQSAGVGKLAVATQQSASPGQ